VPTAWRRRWRVCRRSAGGEAHGAIAGDGQRLVAGAILLECCPRPVGVPAVALGHEPRVGPEEVHAEPEWPRVDGGVGQTVCVAERTEVDLQLAERERQPPTRRLVEQSDERPASRMPRMRRDDRAQRAEVEQVEEISLLQRGLDVMRREDAGEIEDRPRGCRDRQQVDGRRLQRPCRQMQPRALALARRPRRHRDVKPVGTAGAQVPRGSGRAVAEHGPRAVRPYGRKPPTPRAQAVMTHGVDHAMHIDQPAGGPSMLDRPSRQAQLTELGMAHDAILPSREHRDLPIDLEKSTHTVLRSRPT
jgi:hypothetical protein